MIYSIGDIHGQLTMLVGLLKQLRALPLQAEDTLLFLGDYVDRGENSRGVIDLLIALREEHPNCIFLRGNHEQMMLDACTGPPSQPSEVPNYVIHSDQTNHWLQNGGIETLLSYQVVNYMQWRSCVPDSHWEFLRSTEMEFETPCYHFVHAGLLPPGRDWEGVAYDLDPRLWIREPFLSYRKLFNDKVVVFGHTPQRNGVPLIERNKIGIDTGAVFGGRLTAVALEPNARMGRFQRLMMFQTDYSVDLTVSNQTV